MSAPLAAVLGNGVGGVGRRLITPLRGTGGYAERAVAPVRLTHIGGSTILIEVDGWLLLTDPTFDEPGRTYRFGWGSASRKLRGPALTAAELGPIDAVLLTHDHHADNPDTAGSVQRMEWSRV
jgi:hypothetical protein